MIDADWIKARIAMAETTTEIHFFSNGGVMIISGDEFRELLALAARTASAETQRDEMISLVCEHSNSKSFVCIYCVQERQKTIMEDRDRLALALDAAVTFAVGALSPEKYERFCAAIASAKGEQP